MSDQTKKQESNGQRHFDVNIWFNENVKSNQDMLKSIYKSALSQKKVSRADELHEVIVRLFDYFTFFNNVSEDDTVVDLGSIKTLDQILIPNEFKEFIYPASVKIVAGNRRMPDLLQLPPNVSNLVTEFRYSDYINLLDKFRSYFKKDANSDMVTLSSIKRSVSLMDVLSIVSVTGKVNYDSDPYYPITLNDVLGQIVGGSFLQDDADIMITDYCARIRF